MNLTNIDCVGQYELCKVEFSNNFKTPKHDICKIGDYKEPDYIETDSESHGNYDHGIFYVAGNDSDLFDMEELY